MSDHLRLLVELFAAVVVGGVGGWVLRWGQHRDDCRAAQEDAYDSGWDGAYARVIDEDRQRARAADEWFAANVKAPAELEPLEEYAVTRTIYHDLEPEVLGSDDAAGELPGLHDWHDHEPLKWGDEGVAGCPACERQWECPPKAEAGDDTLTRLYHRDGTWEQDQRSIGATGQSLWFLAWQQRQAVA